MTIKVKDKTRLHVCHSFVLQVTIYLRFDMNYFLCFIALFYFFFGGDVCNCVRCAENSATTRFGFLPASVATTNLAAHAKCVQRHRTKSYFWQLPDWQLMQKTKKGGSYNSVTSVFDRPDVLWVWTDQRAVLRHVVDHGRSMHCTSSLLHCLWTVDRVWSCMLLL